MGALATEGCRQPLTLSAHTAGSPRFDTRRFWSAAPVFVGSCAQNLRVLWKVADSGIPS